MKLFEFLEKMSHEKYPVKLNYVEWSGCIEVEVDAFSERWIVSFDNDGFVDFSILKEIDVPNGENELELNSLLNRPQQAWKDAAKDLDIEFISPFKFVGSDGLEYEVTGLLPQFGAEKGTIITSRKDTDEAIAEAEKLDGYYGSGLSPRYYDKYNRKAFIETLIDWGWRSTEEKPEWIKE